MPCQLKRPYCLMHESQVRLAKLGCVDLVVSCVACEDADIKLAAIMLSVTLMEGGNPTAQNILGNALSQAASQPFFDQIHEILEGSIGALKEQKRKIKHAAADREARSAAGLETHDTSLPSLGASLFSMTELIKMLRRMCMGQHTQLQDILRYQKLNQVSINFLEEVVKYLVALEPELTAAIENLDSVVVEGAIRGFLMLSDAMRGPNHANQKQIATTGLMDLGDRIFGKINFEEPPSEARQEKRGRGRLSNYSDAWDLALTRNRLRSRLKGAATSCLLTFLEGVEDPGVPDQMLTTVQWSAICAQMSKCHQAIVRGSQLLEHAQLYEEGIGYYFILSFLKAYDVENQYIEPHLARHKTAVKYFEVRTGFVEIVRHARLERVFFALPDSCIAGGPLDKPYEEMYNCSREDPDRKNMDFLSNMTRLIEREEHQSRIRASALAFTVTRWELICNLTFLISLTVHTNLILGSYVPFWRREEYAAHLATHPDPRSDNDTWLHTVPPPPLPPPLVLSGHAASLTPY